MRKVVNQEYSAAGFYQLDAGGNRQLFNFNPGWRFIKKDIPGAWKATFDDAAWEMVALPHTLELIPENANSSFWYRGPAWYRKHFKLPAELKGRKLFLYFEGVMQKCTVWVNGRKCCAHQGGYLPFVIDITPLVDFRRNNLIAVRADNSDDTSFPPGRPERMMDYCYFGGIYRDVWCFATDKLHVSDPISMNKVADGGIFVHAEDITEKNAKLIISSNILNEDDGDRCFSLETVLKGPGGRVIEVLSTPEQRLPPHADKTITQCFEVKKPQLWSPEHPRIYSINTYVKHNNKTIDSLATKTGIRKIELLNGKLVLNGKERFLFGANRHQDRAYVGNALPNSEHYCDACRMREASFECYRSHYPQDPAFMDACDYFGILAINSVPGWWFYTPDNGFPESCWQAIREMIRINRNRPSCFIWEIGLNESFYPSDFIVKAHKIAHEEYPYAGTFTAEEPPISWHGGYYAHGHFLKNEDYPRESVNAFPTDITYGDDQSGKPYFCRESSGFYDNFVGENALHSICRDWGETPMFIQVQWYMQWLNELYKRKQGLGACIWLAFDYFRGCSAEIAYKGCMDCYRVPKTSFYFFKSQNPPDLKLEGVKTGPMVHIANHLTPFSPEDVVVFSNCEKVRLTLPDGEVIEQAPEEGAMKYPPVVFKGLFNWKRDTAKWASPTSKNPNGGKLKAEGLIADKVVACDIRQAASRVSGLALEVDRCSRELQADGSDFVAVRASFVDKHSNRRVLARNQVYFKVEGEGEIIGDGKIFANPFAAQFGTAVIFVRSTTRSGKIRITAGTTNMGGGEISITSVKPGVKLLKGQSGENKKKSSGSNGHYNTVSGSGMSEHDFEMQGIVTPVLNPNHS